MKKTLIIAVMFFVLLGFAGLFLERVEMITATESDYRIEIDQFEIRGFHENRPTYFLSAKKAKANRNTDYLHIDKVSGTINSGNISIVADKSIISLYTATFQEGVIIEIKDRDVFLKTPQLNYKFFSRQISLPRKSTINLESKKQLVFEKGDYDLNKDVFEFSSVSWSSNKLNLEADKATLTLSPREASFSDNVEARYTNSSGELVLINSQQMFLSVKSLDLTLKDRVQIELEEKRAFADKGFFNNQKNEIILLGNAYMVEGNKRLNADKVRIDTEDYSMEAFDSIEAVVDLD